MKLVPLLEHKASVEALSKGIAVSVFVDVSDYEKQYADNYLRLLGYDPDKKWAYTSATLLSEISNMRGHYVVVGAGGVVVPGLHGDIFYVDIEDEE